MPPGFSENFGIFRTPPERLPSRPAKVLSKIAAIPPLAAQGFNPLLAQRVALPGTKRVLWVIPGRAYTIVTERGESMNVCRVKQAIKKGCGIGVVAPGTSKPRQMWSERIVPDDVTAVRVTRTVLASVHGNAFAWTLDPTEALVSIVLIRKSYAHASSVPSAEGR